MTPPEAAASWLDIDSEGMLAATAAMGDHISDALESYRPIAIPDGPLTAVVVLGMGGSAVAGAVLEALAERRSTVPVVLSSGYECPRFVGAGTLVFAVSFSGETEETLEATAGALKTGAQVVALTGGGSLESLVTASGGPVLRIPPGIPQPRAGVGAMVAPLLLASEEAGFLPGARTELSSARCHSFAGGSRRSSKAAVRPPRSPGGSGGPSPSFTEPPASGPWPPGGGRRK